MKKLLLAVSLTALSFTANAETPYDRPIKPERKVKAQAAAKMVKIYGYRCDSISAFRPLIFGTGYAISCNNFSYSYDVKDVGGRWVVTVN